LSRTGACHAPAKPGKVGHRPAGPGRATRRPCSTAASAPPPPPSKPSPKPPPSWTPSIPTCPDPRGIRVVTDGPRSAHRAGPWGLRLRCRAATQQRTQPR